jgi:murein DD-endopeptidase MepM/ murein hydrolase activator NlpD
MNIVFGDLLMIELTASVGLKGINKPVDTGKVQKLLNQNRHNDPASREISEDDVIGPQTNNAIKQFQKVVVKLRTPDSRVDPGGKTLRFLNEGASAGNYMDEPVRLAVAAGAAVAAAAAAAAGAAASLLPGSGSTILFPLSRRPGLSYKTGARYFGAKRHGGRKHAGCDLIARTGTKIRAVADGEIKKFYLS